MGLYAVILCGGKGERFWPKSRTSLPKQFAILFGRKSLVRTTSERIRKLCPLNQQLFVAPQPLGKILLKEVAAKKKNILLEPARRDTAPAIGLTATVISRGDPQGIMVALPADHIIYPREKFLSAVRLAVAVARKGYLVTFGITPARPDTSYGYIHLGEKIYQKNDLTAYRVLAFKEKPDSETARKYLQNGSYLWNSGIFVWRVDVVLSAFQRYLPDFHAQLMKFSQTIGTVRKAAAIKQLYRQAPTISIDYAIMEKADNVAVVKAPFHWDDVGSWLALERYFPKDEQGNVVKGLWFGKETKGCIIFSEEGVITTLGVNNLVIVRSHDAVLVAEKGATSEIKKLLNEMAKHPKGKKFL